MVTALACLACLLTRDSTPVSTVQGVVDAFNKRDWKGVFSRFEGAKLDLVVASFEKMMATNPYMPKIYIKVGSFTPSGDSASGSVSTATSMGTTPPSRYQDDELNLHKVDGDWKIVDAKGKMSIFSQLSQIARDPAMMEKGRQAAKQTAVLSNLKQIALSVLMYANDYDDKYSFTQANMKTKLQPYLKNVKVWTDPDGKPLDVRINPALIGKSMTSVAEPALCVMLSLGPKDKLVFTNGRTPIAFVDGHCKYVTPAGVAMLKWK